MIHSRSSFLLTISLAMIGLGCFPTISKSVTRSVPIQYPNIQSAIIAANPTGDTVLVSSGIYSGFGNVKIDTLGKAMVIKSVSGAASCIIDGGGTNQIFIIQSGELKTTTISGFTLQNGYAPNTDGVADTGSGGAIYIRDSSPTIINCILLHNHATVMGGALYVRGRCAPKITGCVIAYNATDSINSEGGGCYIQPSTAFVPVLSNDTFYNNISGNSGGGLFINAGTTTISYCVFTNNSAPEHGGGVYVYAEDKSKFTNCIFSKNTADSGGGIAAEDLSHSTYTNCTFDSNDAVSNGAGAYVYQNGSNPVFTNCLFSNNTSTENGGGIDFDLGAIGKVIGCTFTKNDVGNIGGGIFTIGNTAISGCSINQNSAGAGGGIGIDQSNPTVSNCDFVSNAAIGVNGNDGGGGLMIGSHTNGTPPKISGCIFFSNSSLFNGGGILTQGNSTFTNCFIDGNSANNFGAGIAISSGNTSLANCVIDFNTSYNNGAGMHVANSSTIAHITGCSFYENIVRHNGVTIQQFSLMQYTQYIHRLPR